MADKSALWSDIEANYWAQLKAVRLAEDKEIAEERDQLVESRKIKLTKLYHERHQLATALSNIRKQINEEETELDELEQSYEDLRDKVLDDRQKDDEDRRAWFRRHRGNGGANEKRAGGQEEVVDVDMGEDSVNGASSIDASKDGVRQRLYEEPRGNNLSSAPPDGPQHYAYSTADPSMAPEEPNAVEVWNADGAKIGRVEHIGFSNQWVDKILKMPIRRRVQIRAGRKMTPEQLESIYEPSDSKGAKWLSCMIQATGQIQAEPCRSCSRGPAVFSDCVIVGGPDFPKCGNCEWNRQGCQGATPGPQPLQNSSQSLSPSTGFRYAQNAFNGSFTAVNDLASRNSTPKGSRHSLPNGAGKHQPQASQQDPGTPASDGEDEGVDDTIMDAGPEITRETLTLRHDGTMYTAPEIMRGVPIARITPSHPYWEPSWKPLEESIQARLDSWREKLAQQLRDKEKHFMAGRQVNRGTAIMDFLKNGSIHPYQFIAKPWFTTSLFTYDTVYRLVAILDELPKLGITVSPLDWARQRMHELYLEQGEQFNVAKTVHDFYHDPKLAYLRHKAGHRSIGRPAGMKRGEKRGNHRKVSQKRKESASVSATPDGKRKKRRYSSAGSSHHGTPLEREQPPDLAMMPRQSGIPPIQPRPSDLPSAPSQQTPALGSTGVPGRSSTVSDVPDDFETSGYTTSDSFSRDKVMKVDWRVYQIKTASQTTNTEITQYWHWVDTVQDDDGTKIEHMFEHQVLRDVDPPSWGVYKEPIDFHLRLKEIEYIEWAPECQKIIVHTKEIPDVEYRGNVLAHFKRNRTKKRFLSFLNRRGVDIRKGDA